MTHSAQDWTPPRRWSSRLSPDREGPSAHSAGRGSSRGRRQQDREQKAATLPINAFRLVLATASSPWEKAEGVLQMKNNRLPGQGSAAEHEKRNATAGADQRAPGTSEAAPTLTKAPLCL